MQAKDPRLVAIRDETCSLKYSLGPVSRGRNVAIAAANSPIVACADAGCTYAPDWLKNLTAPLIAGEAEYALGGSCLDARSTAWDVASAPFFSIKLSLDGADEVVHRAVDGVYQSVVETHWRVSRAGARGRGHAIRYGGAPADGAGFRSQREGAVSPAEYVPFGVPADGALRGERWAGAACAGRDCFATQRDARLKCLRWRACAGAWFRCL